MRYRDEQHEKCDNLLKQAGDHFNLNRNVEDGNPHEFELRGHQMHEDETIILTKEELIQLGQEIIEYANSEPDQAFWDEVEDIKIFKEDFPEIWEQAKNTKS